jgi:uncharacterized protein
MSRASALEKPDAQPRRKVLALDWKQAVHDLDAKGFAVLPKLLTQAECTALTALYSDDSQFRSRLYGEHVFPLLPAEPGRDFTGGEIVLSEQRPRMQSRASVVPLGQGDAVAFAVHHRPVQGTRGTYRVNLRHGVSEIRTGQRHTAGIIFHDAA